LIITLDQTQTIAIAILVYFLGSWLIKKFPFFNKYCIPASVIGGLIFAFVHMFGVKTGMYSFKFDGSMKNFFMVAFFSTIGFTASLKVIKKAIKPILILFSACVVLVVIQNGWGVAVARFFNIHPLLGLCGGAMALMGGVGSSSAFAPLMEANGAVGGLPFAIATATFGLVAGGLVGGGISRFLIERHKLNSTEAKLAASEMAAAYSDGSSSEDNNHFNAEHLSSGFFQIIIAMGIGTLFSMAVKAMGLVFPVYVGAIFGAAIIRNVGDKYGIKICEKEIDAFGNLFLNIFLSMTIMSLEIWKLGDLVVPLVVMFIGQAIILLLFCIFIIFPLSGKDYDASLIATGTFGYATGTCSNSIASMNEVVRYYDRPSPKAYFVVPIVGGFMMDFAMAILNTGHMNLILKGIL
jgi:glutamate:Na+ symporter, ESS family